MSGALLAASLVSSGINAVINTNADVAVTRSGSGGNVYAGLRVNSDGSCDGNNADGSASYSSPVSEDNWLSSGSATGVYVEYESISGSADWEDTYGGDGVRVSVSTSPRLGVVRSAAFGADVKAIKLHFYDAASGGNLLGTITNAGGGSAFSIQASRST